MRHPPETSKNGGEAGFTLFEILVALFILTLIFSVLFASYSGTLKVTRDWKDTGRVFSMARSSMERMMKDIESAYPSGQTCPFVLEQEVIREKPFPRLSFHSLSRTNPEGPETPPAGISNITYSVRLNSEKGDYELARSETSDSDDIAGSDFVICRGLSSITYRFYDRVGRDISDTFCSSDQKSPPASVVLELTLVNPEDESKPFHFMTRVHPANMSPQES
ncbi:MAG: hypothetical protein A4E74_00284 [Syntrophus sp. PtaB.Bin075]|nr:MAG: hypothetical protein A4E74_00284 [Syntrophus sp. PtaB.Bin075]